MPKDTDNQNDIMDDKSDSGRLKKQAKPGGVRAKQDAGDELIKIYQEENGEEDDDMSKIKPKKRSKKAAAIGTIIVLLLVLLGLSVLSWFLFYKSPKFSGANITFEITAPEEIKSGQTVEYLIDYGNFESVHFRKAQISVRYPDGFIMDQAEPRPTEADNLWNLGALARGESGQIKISGQLIGDLDSAKILSAALNYLPSNFNSEFEEVASAETKITDSLLTLTLEGPEHALVGEKFDYLIKFKNDSEEELKNVQVRLGYPVNFTAEETVPETDDELLEEWVFDSLAGGEEVRIKITGSFITAGEDEQKLTARLSLKVEDLSYQQREEFVVTRVIMGDLSLNLIVNGSSTETAANFSSSLNYSINYKNNTDNDLEDIQLTVLISSVKTKGSVSRTGDGIVDWTSLVDANRGILINESIESDRTDILEIRSITWTATQIDNLDKLEKDDEGSINFSVGLKNLNQIEETFGLADLANLELESKVKVVIGKAAGIVSNSEIETSPLIIKMNSDLVFEGEARYHDQSGQTIGSGPLPPRAGQQTNYEIFWKLSNSIHEIEDLVISAPLADNVSWPETGSVSAGELNFNQSTKTVSWRINRFPLDINQLTARFTVSLTPDNDDIGQVVNLLTKTTLTAVDSQSQGKITIISGPVSTALDNDPQAAGKEVVVE